MRVNLGNSNKQAHLECKARGKSGRNPQFGLTESQEVRLGRAAQGHSPQFPPSAGIPWCPPSRRLSRHQLTHFRGLLFLALFVRKFFLKSAVVTFPPKPNPCCVLRKESVHLLPDKALCACRV